MSAGRRKKEPADVTSAGGPDTRSAPPKRRDHAALTLAGTPRKRKPGAGRPAKGYERLELYVPSSVAAGIRAAAAAERVTLGEAVAQRFRVK